MSQQPLVGQGLLSIKASRLHSDSPHSVGLLWTSRQPDAQTSTWQHTTLTRDIHPCPRRDSNPQSQQARSRRPMPKNARQLGTANRNILLPRNYNYSDSRDGCRVCDSISVCCWGCYTDRNTQFHQQRHLVMSSTWLSDVPALQECQRSCQAQKATFQTYSTFDMQDPATNLGSTTTHWVDLVISI